MVPVEPTATISRLVLGLAQHWRGRADETAVALRSALSMAEGIGRVHLIDDLRHALRLP